MGCSLLIWLDNALPSTTLGTLSDVVGPLDLRTSFVGIKIMLLVQGLSVGMVCWSQ